MAKKRLKRQKDSEISFSFAVTIKIKNMEGPLSKVALVVSKLAITLSKHANAICALISLLGT